MITLEPTTSVLYEVPSDYRVFGYVLELRATDPDVVTRVLLYGGRPIGEPVVLGGPFVMNTSDEIEAAYDDYRLGGFGDIPRKSRLTRR